MAKILLLCGFGFYIAQANGMVLPSHFWLFYLLMIICFVVSEE